MAKRPYRGRPKKKSKAPKAGNLMASLEAMQEQMAQAQAALADETITVSSGGGVVTVVISGHQRVHEIQINPELLDPDEVEILQDMLVAAVNSAIEQSQAMAAERMESASGGLGGGLDEMLGGLGGG